MSKYFFFLMSLLVFSCKNNDQKKDLPVLQLDKDSIFIGNIQKGDSISFRAKITNVGGITLHIIDVGVDCGCTNVSLTNKDIKPSDYAFLNITYNNSKSNDSGYFEKAIVMRNNSSEMFKILKISGNVFR